MESATGWAKEEAGNFVEVCSRGGILTYLKEEKKGRSYSLFLNTFISWRTYFIAVLRTGSKPADVHILPLSYLRVYGNNHSIRGASSQQLWFTPSEKKCLGKNMIASDFFFPSGADDELPQPSSVCEPFVSYYELKSRGGSDYTLHCSLIAFISIFHRPCRCR